MVTNKMHRRINMTTKIFAKKEKHVPDYARSLKTVVTMQKDNLIVSRKSYFKFV